MARPIAMTRTDLSPDQLRSMARAVGDGRVCCRLIAIAAVLGGSSRAEAGRAAGMDRQSLRDWVHRYNADGVAGLSDQPRSGRPAALAPSQMQELEDLVLAGPDLARDGVVRWRCIDLRGEIARRFSVEVHERTVGKLLRRRNLVRLQPRPYHPKKDAAAQEAFKKLRHSGNRGRCGRDGRQADRNLVPGRLNACVQPGWSAGRHHLHLGAARLPPRCSSRQPS